MGYFGLYKVIKALGLLVVTFFVLLAAGIILLASCRKKPSNLVDDASAQQISSSQPSDTPAESLREVTEPVAEAEHAMPPQPHPETQPAPIAQAGQPAPDFYLPRR